LILEIDNAILISLQQASAGFIDRRLFHIVFHAYVLVLNIIFRRGGNAVRLGVSKAAEDCTMRVRAVYARRIFKEHSSF